MYFILRGSILSGFTPTFHFFMFDSREVPVIYILFLDLARFAIKKGKFMFLAFIR